MIRLRNILTVVSFIVVFLLPVGVTAQRERVTKNTSDSLRRALRRATTPRDSADILIDMYDVNTASKSIADAREDNINILNMLYEVSLRAKDTTTAYDAMRYLSTVARYDTRFIEQQLKRLSRMPDAPEKRDAQTFLRIQKYFWTLRDTTVSDAELLDRYAQIRKEVAHAKGSRNVNDRLEQQFALILYGSNLVESEQMEKYLGELEGLIMLSPDHREQLKSYYYRIAAMLYDENENQEKAVEADRIMLNILAAHDSLNILEDREFKSYDFQRFTVYRRMMSNYKAMKPDSVAIVYNELQKIMKRLPHHQINEVDEATVSGMWHMFKHDYKKALKDLRVVLTSKRFQNKPNYIKAYIAAASEVGSEKDLKAAIDLYSELLLRRARAAANTEYTRLKIEYQVDSLVTESRDAVRQARDANRRQEETEAHFFNYGLVGIGLFLTAIIIIQIIANRRMRRMADKLKVSNDNLLRERNTLSKTKADLEQANANARQAMNQKSEFIHNVSHEISEPVKAIVGFTQLIVDSIPEERRKYLTGFVDIITHNGSLLQRIVGDILDTAEVDDAVTNIVVTRFNPEEIINLVVDSFRPRLTQDQKFVVEPLRIVGTPGVHDNDKGVDTDAGRLEQILNNVLDNAVKFGEKGSITIETELNYDSGNMTIAISDEGHGIPAGKEEQIFERFEKLGHYNGGLGLGLYISRAIVRLLNGEIKVDTSYHHGTRMIITLPMRLRPPRASM